MAIKVKSRKNLLDFVPVKNTNPKYESVKDEIGIITIKIHRNSLMDRFVRKFIKKTPLTFDVKLDEFGSFIYDIIDDKKNIYEIGEIVKEHFGEDAEPLYSRLGAFMNLLKNNNFIYFEK